MTTDEISITTVDAAKALRACKDNMHCSVCPLIFQSPQCSNLEALAADRLEQLQQQLNTFQAERDILARRVIELEAQHARALKDIPHTCRTCAHDAADCDYVHYESNRPDCLGWVWRGAKEESHE